MDDVTARRVGRVLATLLLGVIVLSVCGLILTGVIVLIARIIRGLG